MRVTEVTPGELGPSELARWEEIRSACPWTASPFFSVEYTLAVGAVRPDTRVALVEEGDTVVAFLPYHRRRGEALPVGTGLADYQGAISEPCAAWSPVAVLRALGLRAYSFGQVPVADPRFRPHVRGLDHSPVLEHRGDFGAYVDESRQVGRGGPREALKKRRRLARAAEVRFDFEDSSPDTLDRLLTWKTEQHRRTGSLPIFEFSWVTAVLAGLTRTRATSLTGAISSLHADGELISAQLWLRSGSLLHAWVLGFDPRRAALSPGSVLLLALIEAMADHGVHTLDFGKGREPYKERFTNGSVELGEGVVSANRVAGARAWIGRKALHAAYRTPLGGTLGRLHERRLFRS